MNIYDDLFFSHCTGSATFMYIFYAVAMSNLSTVSESPPTFAMFYESFAECMAALKQHELNSLTHFVCVKRPANFGKQGKLV